MAADAQQIAQPIPGERSSLPAMVLIAGWFIPGLGHLMLGKWIRALLLFVSIVAMFAIGLALQGKIYSPSTGDILDILGFAGQLGLGLLCGLAHWLGWGASSAVNTLADYGTKFIEVAGLLNYIAAVDAHSLANGRKAS
jgi:hypothetical protein